MAREANPARGSKRGQVATLVLFSLSSLLFFMSKYKSFFPTCSNSLGNRRSFVLAVEFGVTLAGCRCSATDCFQWRSKLRGRQEVPLRECLACWNCQFLNRPADQPCDRVAGAGQPCATTNVIGTSLLLSPFIFSGFYCFPRRKLSCPYRLHNGVRLVNDNSRDYQW